MCDRDVASPGPENLLERVRRAPKFRTKVNFKFGNVNFHTTCALYVQLVFVSRRGTNE